MIYTYACAYMHAYIHTSYAQVTDYGLSLVSAHTVAVATTNAAAGPTR